MRRFGESLLGRDFTAVTLDPPGLALTDNYVKATLDLPYTPNRLIRLRPRALNDQGVNAQLISAADEESIRSSRRSPDSTKFLCTRRRGGSR